jgi:enoyl-CoA hydratase/carnithine racemase
MDMIVTGEAIDAHRAYQLGLVTTLVDSDAESAALGRAEIIARNGATAVRASRDLANRAFSPAEDDLWAANLTTGQTVMNDPYVATGLQLFTGRRS